MFRLCSAARRSSCCSSKYHAGIFARILSRPPPPPRSCPHEHARPLEPYLLHCLHIRHAVQCLTPMLTSYCFSPPLLLKTFAAASRWCRARPPADERPQRVRDSIGHIGAGHDALAQSLEVGRWRLVRVGTAVALPAAFGLAGQPRHVDWMNFLVNCSHLEQRKMLAGGTAAGSGSGSARPPPPGPAERKRSGVPSESLARLYGITALVRLNLPDFIALPPSPLVKR